MNLFSKQSANKNNSNLPVVVAAFILFAVSTAFGQTATENNNDSNLSIATTSSENSVVKREDSATNSNMNFVLWFMGSKQDPNAKVSPSADTTKKEFMTSGTAPNRLLIKAFLKKAVNFEIATV
ncbi:hypothetical protein [Flavobacterium nackdongense]|uniref:Uncharacterized protein n=1 Tax=Flavobacterium nackdongense TaxID=2547394 RepID=A0A4P6YAD2_9FLAO|nr:hypothetical protein [Flavobacterium nackdongense]QBN20016.1 hypothetical protein E1750_14825 [Flavobacterium nackdongense]